jgi:hypothetical protein
MSMENKNENWVKEQRTVLRFDQQGYSAKAAQRGQLWLQSEHEWIERTFTSALKQANLDQVDFWTLAVRLTAPGGDGQIYAFKNADDAHQVAVNFIALLQQSNRISPPIDQRIFRIAMATGVYARALQERLDDASLAIIEAVRIEAAAAANGILIDPSTHSCLSDNLRACYERCALNIKDKKGVRHAVHRWVAQGSEQIPENLTIIERMRQRLKTSEELPEFEGKWFKALVKELGKIELALSVQSNESARAKVVDFFCDRPHEKVDDLFFALENCSKEVCEGRHAWVSELLLLTALRCMDFAQISLSRPVGSRSPEARIGRTPAFGELVAAVAIAGVMDIHIHLTDRPTTHAIKLLPTGADYCDSILRQLIKVTVGLEDPAQKPTGDAPLTSDQIGAMRLWFLRRRKDRKSAGVVLDLSSCPIETKDETITAVAEAINAITLDFDPDLAQGGHALMLVGTGYTSAQLNKHLQDIYARYCQPEPKT